MRFWQETRRFVNSRLAAEVEGESRINLVAEAKSVILGKVLILIVEDHADTRLVLTSLLGRSGFRIISANRVKEATELLEKMRFDILLSDLGLPDGDGLEVVRKAKALQPHIRAIALTARGSEKDHDVGRDAGFDYYLTKPFDLHELRRALENCKLAA